MYIELNGDYYTWWYDMTIHKKVNYKCVVFVMWNVKERFIFILNGFQIELSSMNRGVDGD